MDNSQPAPGPTGNSSDFVRKLYKMLEDPSYSQIVRWGDDRDSFVVLECEKFTKSILPKHFKHSNFASFVRQLNKYDFHKVRQNNEETGQSPYGPNAWEFKHPEFRADSKESLDNIRRKAPAPRKQAQSHEDSIPTQQLDLMNQQLVAQQQQYQHLSDRFTQLTVNHQAILQELHRVQKTVLNHEQVVHYIITYLHSMDARQRAAFQSQGAVGSELSPSQIPPMDDDTSSPLQHATKLLNDMNAEIQFNLGALESAGDLQNRISSAVPTPPLDPLQRNGSITQTPAASNQPIPYAKMNNGELEQVVYPVGATNGIDPMYEHAGNSNVPYPLPPKDLESSDSRGQYTETRKKGSHANPGWARSPRILLVEDDQTCRQIGGKFLYSFCCVIDTALDGLEAVNKVQSGANYDLILMDIIMPNLDGASACSLIRRFDATPIIAMTSNIRSTDIDLYFQNGMNDVLPKPFTRQSLLNMLEKHLVHLKVPGIEGQPHPAPPGATTITQNSASQSVKEENSPGQSPATSINNWQSPGQFAGVSPINPAVPNQFIQQQQQGQPSPAFAMDSNGNIQYPQAQMGVMNAAAARAQKHRRHTSDMSSPVDVNNYNKRQRVYATSTNGTPVVNAMQAGRTL